MFSINTRTELPVQTCRPRSDYSDRDLHFLQYQIYIHHFLTKQINTARPEDGRILLQKCLSKYLCYMRCSKSANAFRNSRLKNLLFILNIRSAIFKSIKLNYNNYIKLKSVSFFLVVHADSENLDQPVHHACFANDSEFYKDLYLKWRQNTLLFRLA